MSNLNIKQDFIPAGRGNRPGRVNPVKYVTIHNTGNTSNGANAKNHAAYVKSDAAANAPVSWHYTVDERDIYQHLPDNEDAFHAGDGVGDGNRKSVGIEICMNSDGDLLGATDNAIALTAALCKQYNIPIENIVQHHHWTGKNCPQMIRSNKPYDWDTFIYKVKKLMGIPEPPPPTAKTLIMGVVECTAEQLNAYAKSKNPNAPEYGAFFIEEGNAEGVRGDIAFCQSCHETGFFKFGGDVFASQNNFCGLGAVGGGAKGASFATPRDGIRAQIQHLKAYACKEPLKQACIDPRFSLVTRGIAPNWEDLNGRWAVPGNGYGENIVNMWNTVRTLIVPTVSTAPIPALDEPSDWAKEAWEWAKANAITDGTNPRGAITREQTATMLYRFSRSK
jgi:hypothetical protein